MSDALVSGRKIRTLNIIDHHHRFYVGIAAAEKLPALGVLEIWNV